MLTGDCTSVSTTDEENEVDAKTKPEAKVEVKSRVKAKAETEEDTAVETERDLQVTRDEQGKQFVSGSHQLPLEQHLPENQDYTAPPTSVSTSKHYYAGPVSQYDLSNASNVTVSVGDQRTNGCLSNETLNSRIQRLRDVFVEVQALEKAKKLLKTYGHVTLCGAPGDGKTSIALMLCDAYRCRNYQILFVENIDDFEIDTLTRSDTDLIIVFDDVFGSVSFSCNMEKLRKVFSALSDKIINTKSKTRHKKRSETQAKEESKRDKARFCVVFTSRSYNFNEGCSQFFLYKSSGLFRPETVLDLTKEGLTSDEKIKMMSSFQQWSDMCDISQKDVQVITDLRNETFGFPFICKLYFTTPVYQMETVDFFLHPLTYLRGDLDLIVREGSSRSAAIILLILCEGKLDLVAFQMKTDGKSIEDAFQAVKEIIPSCTRTEIRKEINNFSGSYCTVEHQTASFSHPSIYDAAACAFGKLNIILLLQYCSLRFLYERVRINRGTYVRPPEPDDVTNMIYIDQSLYPLVVSRLVEAIKQRNFNMTVNHPVLSDEYIATSLLSELTDVLQTLIRAKDKDTDKCFLYWVSYSESKIFFDEAINLLFRSLDDSSDSISNNVIADLFSAVVICTELGKLTFLKTLSTFLHQIKKSVVDFRTRENKTLLMIASESGHLEVFNFLLQEGADDTSIGRGDRNCLHFASESGSESIAKVILDRSSDLVNKEDGNMQTPALICAEKGHVNVLKLLVSKGADLNILDMSEWNFLHLACHKGHLSVVKYGLSLIEELGLSINQKCGISQITPVMLAAAGGHHAVYEYLVSEGADLSLADKDNRNCLIWACKGGNASIVGHLLSLNMFDINKKGGWKKQTPIMIAAARGNYDVVCLLVSKGADLTLTDEDNANCLMFACQGGNISIVKHLLSLKPFNINIKGGLHGQTPIMKAAEGGFYDVFNLLLSEGADVAQNDRLDRDCLMLACEGGSIPIVKHLLSLKTFDINRGGGWKDQTPVMMAAYFGHHDIYNLLVSSGADLSLTDRYDNDILLLACEGGNVAIVKHLLSLQTFDLNKERGPSPVTPLKIAAREGYGDIYNLLVSEGADQHADRDSDDDMWDGVLC